jgi:pimeloyl-ACP methyl ester carboxylesterase
MLKLAGLEYEVRGDGDAILFIHGGIIADSFAPMMKERALEGYRRIRYRRRGYGGSDSTSSAPSIEEFAMDARMLLAGLGVQRVHVVGHSGGGPISVQLAIDVPDLVRSLTLMEPALQTAEMAAAFDERLRPLVEMCRAGESGKAVHLWMRATGGPDWRTEIERLIPGAGQRAIDDAAGTFEGDLGALRRWAFDQVAAFRIAQPVLDLVSERNASNVERVTEMFRTAVPHTELVIMPDADHNMQMNRPGPVAAGIAPFLARHTS